MVATTLGGASLTVLSDVTTGAAPTVASIQPYDASAGALAVTLPALSGRTAGQQYGLSISLSDASGNGIVISAAGSDKSDNGRSKWYLKKTAAFVVFQVITINDVKKWKLVGAYDPATGLDGSFEAFAGSNRKAATVTAVTDSSTGTSGGNTIAAVTDVASAANGIATLAAKQNAILTALKGAGLMA